MRDSTGANWDLKIELLVSFSAVICLMFVESICRIS